MLTANPSTKTGFQFPLWSIAVVVTVLAVVLAALAPWLREFDAAQWRRFATVWLFAVIGFPGAPVITALSWSLSKQGRGRTLFVVQPQRFGAMRTFLGVMTVVFLGLLLSMSFAVARESSAGSSPGPMNAPNMTFFGAAIIGFNTGSMICGFFFTPGEILLCENGMSIGPSLTPWRQMRGWRWEEKESSCILFLRFAAATHRIVVAEDDKAAIEELLTSLCEGREPTT